MLVIIQTVSLPASFPISIIVLESFSASSIFFINAPLPHVTSKTSLFAPEAIFLLIILELIKGIFAVQLIASLKAYNFLSAGAKFNVWPIKLIPIFCTFCINSSIEISVL